MSDPVEEIMVDSIEDYIVKINQTDKKIEKTKKTKKQNKKAQKLAQEMSMMSPVASGEGFKCHLCDKVCLRKDNMNRHLASVHWKVKNLSCRLCGREFYETKEIKRHIVAIHFRDAKKPVQVQSYKDEYFKETIKNGKALLECTLCNRTLTSQLGRKRHIGVIHMSFKPYPCPVCHDKSYCEKRDLTLHMDREHGMELPSSYKPMKKPKLTNDSDYIKEDPDDPLYSEDYNNVKEDLLLEEEPDNTIPVCSLCADKDFESSQGLTEHFESCLNNQIVSEIDGFVWKCNVCTRKRFLSSEECKSHLVRVHLKILHYKCNICNEYQLDADQLASHSQEHSNISSMQLKISDYNCPICCVDNQQKYLSKEDLISHLTQDHDVKEKIAHQVLIKPDPEDLKSCDLCQVMFSDQVKLNQHLFDDHIKKDISYTCDICGKKLAGFSPYIYHMKRMHDVERDQIVQDKKTEENAILRDIVEQANSYHEMSVASQLWMYECDKCDKFYKGKRGLRVHFRDNHLPEYLQFLKSLKEEEEEESAEAK
jgi:hypothetical protein